jgi:hypothetical protein
MENFVAEIVAPKDARAAEKLSIALMGKEKARSDDLRMSYTVLEMSGCKHGITGKTISSIRR